MSCIANNIWTQMSLLSLLLLALSSIATTTKVIIVSRSNTMSP